MKKYFVLFILSCMLTTCEKIELPIQMVGKPPIFELTGTIGNKPLKLAAGLNNLELQTGFEIAPLNVVILKGELNTKGCGTGCKGSLALAIRQNLFEFRSIANKKIVVDRKPYYSNQRDSFVMTSVNRSVLTSGSSAKYKYKWTLNDKEYSEDEKIALSVTPIAPYRVCLAITHPDGSEANQCQVVDFNLLDSFPGLKVSIEPLLNQNKTWTLQAKVRGVGPFKYMWNNVVSDNANLEVDLKKATKHCLIVTDVKGHKASVCLDLHTEAKIRTKADFDLNYEASTLRSWTQYNTVELHYIDDQGVVWNTINPNQPGSSVFEILEEAPYEMNAQNQPTRKIKIKLNALLYSRNLAPRTINATGFMAVAVPR